MKKLITTRLMLLTVLVMSVSAVFAQNDRDYIRKQIQKWGECRNVAITKTNGDLALYGDNGWAASGIPSGLQSSIRSLHDKGEFIDDVQLTERGNYIVLYGDNGFEWSGIPYSLEKQIRKCNDDKEVVTSVTFNDDGDWIVISTSYIYASSTELNEWMKGGMDSYGQVWAACITNDACVVVYENGYRYLGNVPQGLKNALEETTMDVYRIKIAGNSWFFADKKGGYRYNM